MVINLARLKDAMERLPQLHEHKTGCPLRGKGQACCLEDPAVQEALWEQLEKTPLR